MKKFAILAIMLAAGLGVNASYTKTVYEEFYGSKSGDPTYPCKGELVEVCGTRKTTIEIEEYAIRVTTTAFDLSEKVTESKSYETHESAENIIERIIKSAPANAVVTVSSDYDDKFKED